MDARGRALLFWAVCVPVRVWLSTRGDNAWLRVCASLVGSAWVLGCVDSRVGFFGGEAWWREERPAHGALWLAYAGTGDDRWLQVDVAFGALNYLRGRHTS
jgi:hypothetical protein